MKETGCVYLVGAGPGDEGLLTVRGAQLLRSCGCVVYDHLASERLLDEVQRDCERIFVGKQKGCHSKAQKEINEILVKKAYEHSIVVRLKGGDPFVFGRGGEEAMALKEAGIAYEVVPGVTSAVAVPAAAGIPVTHRRLSRSFHVITGHTGEDGGLPEDFNRLGNCGGTVVFLMGVSQLGAISCGLISQGWPGNTPVAVIQNGTLPDQKTVRGTLENIEEKVKDGQIGTPAVIVAGETAGLSLLSGQKRSLEGIRVGITGTDFFTCRLRRILESRGASASRVCRMQVVPMKSHDVMDSYQRIGEYTWLVFTSGNGVRLFLDGLFRCEETDLRCLGRLKLAAIGRGTEEALWNYHLRADYVPEVFTSRELAFGLAERLTDRDRVLIPRARQGSSELPRILQAAGIFCRDLPVYDVEGTDVCEAKIREVDYDYLVFASASGVTAFMNSGLSVGKARVCCIGEATAKRLKQYGCPADYVAQAADAEGIAQQIAEAEAAVQKQKEG